jgi:very-long-chain (3R)-3-hydroxyacyl-CoA dehydratase
MSVIKAYLFFYNLISAVGWAYVLYLTSTTIFYQHQAGKNWENIATACWDTVSPTLKVVQSLAAMEIVHSGVGFVKSPLGSTVMQGTKDFVFNLT